MFAAFVTSKLMDENLDEDDGHRGQEKADYGEDDDWNLPATICLLKTRSLQAMVLANVPSFET